MRAAEFCDQENKKKRERDTVRLLETGGGSNFFFFYLIKKEKTIEQRIANVLSLTFVSHPSHFFFFVAAGRFISFSPGIRSRSNEKISITKPRVHVLFFSFLFCNVRELKKGDIQRDKFACLLHRKAFFFIILEGCLEWHWKHRKLKTFSISIWNYILFECLFRKWICMTFHYLFKR